MTDADAEKAIDWLRDNAPAAAQARHDVVVTEAWIKTVLAEQTLKSRRDTVAERDAEARASEAYKEAVKAHGEAVKIDSHFRFLREAASAKFEYWRSMRANERAARV